MSTVQRVGALPSSNHRFLFASKTYEYNQYLWLIFTMFTQVFMLALNFAIFFAKRFHYSQVEISYFVIGNNGSNGIKNPY